MPGGPGSVGVGASPESTEAGGAVEGTVGEGAVGVFRVRTGVIRIVGSGEIGRVGGVVGCGIGCEVGWGVGSADGGLKLPAPEAPFDASARMTTPATTTFGRAVDGGRAWMVSVA